MCDRSRDELLAELAAAKAQLSKLDEERSGLQLQISSLQDELSSIGILDPTTRQAANPKVANPRTTREKIVLFRSLFRGRSDVFPKRWENTQKGRQDTHRPVPTSGYAAYAINPASSVVIALTRSFFPSQTRSSSSIFRADM